MEGEQQKIKVITLRCREKSEFMGRYLPEVGFGGYQLAHPAIELGTQVLLQVTLVGFPRQFELLGRVVWRQSQPPSRPDLPKGVGIEFLLESRETLRALLQLLTSANAPDQALQAKDDRSENRVKVELFAEFLHEDHLCRERVVDVSSRGLFIESDLLLPVGQEFTFFLFDAPATRPLVMHGRVVWNTSPSRRGFGVELIFDSRKHKSDFKKIMDDMTQPNGADV